LRRKQDLSSSLLEARAKRRTRAIKLLAAALFVYATGGPAVFARSDGSQTFFTEQRELSDQKQRASDAKQHRVRDFIPSEATRSRDAAHAAVQPTFIVDVIGDSMAYLDSDGLKEAFADQPEIAVSNKARGSSGLVRDDYFDWLKAARDLVADKDKNRIDYVVVQLGINDLQPMKDGATSVDALTDRWRELYAQRIRALVEPFKQAHIPVLWVGLPPMRNGAFNSQIAKLNEMYKDDAEAAGAKYIDIWDAFADENGAYSAFGPDISGQQAKLRAADDIHYTKAGARKAAQFLEGDIRRAFESAKPTSDFANLPPDIEQATIDINAEIRREMGLAPNPGGGGAATEAAKPLAGPVLPLTARPISHGGTLATRADVPLTSVSALVTGLEPRPKPGRADDFAWPRQPGT
jgi:uncharacterized protein